MTLTRRGKFWHSRFRFKGREYSASTKCTSHREALAWENQYKAKLAMGEVGLATPPCLRVAWEHWRDTHAGQLSLNHLARAESAFRLHILPLLGDFRADMITVDMVEQLRQRYLETPSKRNAHLDLTPRKKTQSGANTIVQYLKAVLNHLVRIGILKRMPFEIRPLRFQHRVRPHVPVESLDAFLDLIDAKKNRDLAIAVRAMVWMGLRESEALGMRWEWFSPGLDCYTPGRTKGKEAAIIPVPDELAELLRGSDRLSPWVIPSPDGKPHRQGFTRKAIRQAGAVLGVANLSPHGLRASCATNLARKDINLRVIQRLLRHKDIRTTLLYVDIGLQEMREAQRKVFGK